MKVRVGVFVAVAFAAAMEVTVPQSWTDKQLEGFRTPLTGLSAAPKMLPEAEYYKLAENNLKTYPVYTPDKEPANYIEWLKQ